MIDYVPFVIIAKNMTKLNYTIFVSYEGLQMTKFGHLLVEKIATNLQHIQQQGHTYLENRQLFQHSRNYILQSMSMIKILINII